MAIGSLGVISTVTLKAVPSYTLERVDEPLPLEETLAAMDDHVAANEHWEFFTFPYTGVAFTRASNRTDAPPQPPSRAERIVKDVVAENLVLGAICAAGKRLPRAVPGLNRLLPKLVTREVRTDRGDRVFANQRLVRFTEMEYAIPREHGADAIRRILDLIERRRAADHVPARGPLRAAGRRPDRPEPRPRELLHRRPRLPRHRARGLLPRRSRRSCRATAGARTGASATT